MSSALRLEASSETPREPSPSQIRRGLNWNIAAGCMAMVWLVLPGTPLTMLMECIHGDALYVGLLVGIQQAAMLFQIPGAVFSGLFRRRKIFWAILSLLHRAVWFVPALFFFRPDIAVSHGARLIVGMILISSVAAQLSTSSWHAWMADLIPERQRSRFWGTRQSFLWTFYLPAVLLFGYLLDFFPDPRAAGGNYAGFAMVFTFGALAGCMDIVLHLKVPETIAVARTIRKGLWSRITAPFHHRDFKYLTCAMTAWYFAIGLVGAFGVLYLSRTFNMSYTALAVLGVSSSLGGILSGFLWGYIIQRVGPRSFSLSMLSLAPLMGISWFFLRNVHFQLNLPWIGGVTLFQPILIQFVFGFAAAMIYAGIGLCQLNLLAVFTSREDRAIAMASHWTTVGIGSALGPIFAGRLVNLFEYFRPSVVASEGFSFGFMHLLVILHMAVIGLVVLPLFSRIRRQKGDLPVGVTLSGLFVGNPLRLMGNILTMDMSRSSRRHLRAIHGMGRQRYAPAVIDLQKQTRNPSSPVRAAAVRALGRIGSVDAVNILTQLLQEEPHGLYTLPALQALREAASPLALNDILPWIEHDNPEISREAIRALGALRDPRAVPGLRHCLESTRNPLVAVSCAEALEALKDAASAGMILHLIPNVDHPVIKKNLAVSVSNLLSAPETFYRILADEFLHPGTLFDRLLNDIVSAPPLCSGPRQWNAELTRRVNALREAITRRDAPTAVGRLGDFSVFLNEAWAGTRAQPEKRRRTKKDMPREEPAAALTEFVEQLATITRSADQQQSARLFDCEIPLALHLLASGLRYEKRIRRP